MTATDHASARAEALQDRMAGRPLWRAAPARWAAAPHDWKVTYTAVYYDGPRAA